MLVVVIFQRLARHVGGERVIGIRKIGQREDIGLLLEWSFSRDETGHLLPQRMHAGLGSGITH